MTDTAAANVTLYDEMQARDPVEQGYFLLTLLMCQMRKMAITLTMDDMMEMDRIATPTDKILVIAFTGTSACVELRDRDIEERAPAGATLH